MGVGVSFVLIFCLFFSLSAVAVNFLLNAFPAYNMYIVIGYVCSAVTAVTMAAAYKLYEHIVSFKREKKKLGNIIKNINSMVMIWSDDFGYVNVNDAFVSAVGYNAADLTGNVELLKKILPADAFSVNPQDIINNRTEEFNISAYGGKQISTVWNTSIAYMRTVHKKKKYLMMSIGPNLTETINMKNELMRFSKELSELENKYTLSMELSEIGLVLKEPDNEKFYISDQIKSTFGIETNLMTSEEIRSYIEPADLIVFDTISANMEKPAGPEGSPTHFAEFRAKTAEGSVRWFQLRYKTMPRHNMPGTGMGGAVIDITGEKEKDAIIEKMAYIDDVTGIYNRNKFMMMGQELFDCIKENKNLDYWVIVIDIDNFHIINDTCGYATGNEALCCAAEIITGNLTDGGFAARIGGDNFAVLIKATENETLPEAMIKKIQNGISDIRSEGLEKQEITCSAGFCRMTDGGGDFSTVLDRAEFALSLSDGTKSNVMKYDNSVHDAIIRSNTVEKELALAIENHELLLYYQPKIDLNSGEVMGMEALIRWQKPDGRIVPPSDFIPIAEHSMLITKISHFVLFEACRQNKKWQDMGLKPVTVSINLTAVDFYQTDVTGLIKNALDETGLDPQWLDVELTESLALKNIDHAIEQMNEIKNLGVKLSMDDFGTGYSSLSYIQVLPISLLKLDRSFIMYLEDDAISREIVSAVIRIAKSKQIETIAEGIETTGQAHILKDSGCDWAQGYFFGKPMTARDFEKFLSVRQKEPARF